MDAYGWRPRGQGLVCARASGVSVWHLLTPVLLAGAMIGGLKVGRLNPVSAVMIGKYEQLNSRYPGGRTSLMELSGGGLWLRQRDPGGISVIFADHTDPDSIVLHHATVFPSDDAEHYRGRLAPQHATQEDQHRHRPSPRHTLGPAP